MATEARTPMERTNHGWWIPEDMPVEAISLFPSPLIGKKVVLHEAEAVTRAAPLALQSMHQVEEEEHDSVDGNSMVVKVEAGNFDQEEPDSVEANSMVVKAEAGNFDQTHQEEQDSVEGNSMVVKAETGNFLGGEDSSLTEALLALEQAQRQQDAGQMLVTLNNRDAMLETMKGKLDAKSSRILELATRLGKRDDDLSKLKAKLKKSAAQLSAATEELERSRALALGAPGSASEVLLPLASVAEKGESPYRLNPFASPPARASLPTSSRSPAPGTAGYEGDPPILCVGRDASSRVLWAVQEVGGGGGAEGTGFELGLDRFQAREEAEGLAGAEMCMQRESRVMLIDWVHAVGLAVFIMGCFATNDVAELVLRLLSF